MERARRMCTLGVALVGLLAPLWLAGASDAQQSGAARLGTGDESSESWDLVASFVSGHRLFARFSISNEGPGDRTGYALGQIVFPDGRVAPFQNGRLEGDWELSEDRLRMEIGSSVLDLHGPANHFEVDKNKKGVKVFLDFEPGTEEPRPWSAAPKGLHHDLLVLGAKIRGTIWVRDVMGDAMPTPVTGHVTLTHSWMDRGEPDFVQRRVEPQLLASADGTQHAYLASVVPIRGEPKSWAVVRRARPDGTSDWLETDAVTLTSSGEHAASEKGYPVPTRLEVGGDRLRGSIALEKQLVEHDPLDAAPRPFRWLLSFRTAPRQVWLVSAFDLTFDADAPLQIRGDGLTSFYFINPQKD